jgi:hypothetical protein
VLGGRARAGWDIHPLPRDGWMDGWMDRDEMKEKEIKGEKVNRNRKQK